MNIDHDEQEDFDAFLARIAARPLREQEDLLLEYFVESFVELTTADLRMLRARFIGRAASSSAAEEMIDVLDGHLMLHSANKQTMPR